MISLRAYQSRGIDALRAHVTAGRKRIILTCPTGGGKCLGIGTKVLMFDGRSLPVEEISQFDLVMGPDSKPRMVLGTTVGSGRLVKVIPVKGEPWTCNEDHVLTLVHTETGETVDISVKEWRLKSKWWRHCHKLWQPSRVTFPGASELPIDPYFIGVWLGDGSKLLNGVAVTKPDTEILEACKSVAKKWGLKIRTDFNENGCPTHHLAGERGGLPGSNRLLVTMRDLLGRPWRGDVPLSYLTASEPDRLELLAGLIDTDGYAHHGYVEIVQKQKGAADGVAFLARSLGLRVTRRVKRVNGVGYHRLFLSGNLDRVPCRIQRKQTSARKQKKDALRTGFRIEDAGVGEFYGFELDGDGRFLLGDFTVTHNSVLAAAIIQSARWNFDAKILFVVHRLELLDQMVKHLYAWGIPDAGVIRADDSRTNPAASVQVATIQTLRRRNPPEAHIVIVDECHLAASESWIQTLKLYPDATIIGLTATPTRLDGKPLGVPAGIFEAIEVAATYKQLIADQHIVAPRCFSTREEPKLEKLHTRQGDFVIEELEEAVMESRVLGDVIVEYQKHLRGLRTIVFACTVKHSKAMVERFQAVGVKAVHVDADTPEHARKKIAGELEFGFIELVSNVGIYCEGVDFPCVKGMILARPTKSFTLYRQMAGRALRPWNESLIWSRQSWSPSAGASIVPVIIDCGGNIRRHGFPHEDVSWSLSEETTVPKEKKPTSCVRCGAYIPYYPCTACGYAPVVSPRNVREDKRLELVEVSSSGAQLDPRKMGFDREVEVCRQRGYKPMFASYRYKDKYGEMPPWSWKSSAESAFQSDRVWQQRCLQRQREKAARQAAEAREAEPDYLTDDEIGELF